MRLDELQQSWARCLLGAEPWHNGAVCESELGLHMSGFARAVRSVALRRARVFQLPAGDLYRSMFEHTAAQGIGWSSWSLRLLDDWGVPRFEPRVAGGSGYQVYKRIVDGVLCGKCAGAWVPRADMGAAQIPYRSFQKVQSDKLALIQRLVLPWASQLHVRSWCRLRAGLLRLRCRDGRRSRARFQDCIFCGLTIRNAMIHVLGACPSWSVERTNFSFACGLEATIAQGDVAVAMLDCSPTSKGFCIALDWASKLDTATSDFWH